jgi:hypothetical protein
MIKGIILFILIALLVGMLVFNIMDHDKKMEDFCESKGYKHEFDTIGCYKIEQDVVVERKITYRDGEYYWRDVHK